MTNAPRGPADRPMSPHLQIWRWHITMATSILHRASIFALYLGLLLLAGWLVALAAGPESSACYEGVMSSPLGLLVLFGITVMLFFNVAYNVRQAFWDLGHGFQLKTAEASAWACIAFGVVAAVAFWAGLAIRGVL